MKKPSLPSLILILSFLAILTIFTIGCSKPIPRPVVGHKVLLHDLSNQVNAILWGPVMFLDPQYTLLSKAEIERAVAASSVDSSRYLTSIFDCDDFAILLKGYMAKWAADSDLAYPLPFMVMMGVVTTPQGEAYGHAWNAVIDHSHKLWLIEPQTGKFYDPKKMPVIGIFLILI